MSFENMGTENTEVEEEKVEKNEENKEDEQEYTEEVREMRISEVYNEAIKKFESLLDDLKYSKKTMLENEMMSMETGTDEKVLKIYDTIKSIHEEVKAIQGPTIEDDAKRGSVGNSNARAELLPKMQELMKEIDVQIDTVQLDAFSRLAEGLLQKRG